MKPMKLTMRGINSYRTEQTIDFEQLTSSGLFGIFGPTGSGKSSILDAITLALYAKLPRSTKNFININEKTASVSFLFSITTTETHRYLVERSFRYHGEKETATVRNISGRLLDVTGETPEVLADRPTEVTQECTALLGLTSDDFMRTVVLPQGQFSEFLKLKNIDRRKMLQRIFHLEKYGLEMTQKIASARQKQDLLLSNLEGQLNVYEGVTSEQLQSLTKQLQIVSGQTKKLSAEVKTAENAFREADELRTLLNEYEPLKKEFDVSTKKVPYMEEREKQLEISKKANQIRPFAEQEAKASSDFEQAVASLQTAKVELSHFLSDYEKLEEERNQIQKEYTDKLPYFVSEEGKLQTAISQIATIENWSQKKAFLEQTLKEQNALLETDTKRQQQFLKENSHYLKEIENLEAEAESIKPQPEQIRALEKGHAMEETYREKRRIYEKSQSRFSEKQQQQKAEKKKLEQLCIQLSALIKIVSKQQQDFSIALEKALNLQEKRRTDREQIFQTMDELRNQNLASILRNQLKEGQICPVCGSLHHDMEAVQNHAPENDAQIQTILNEYQSRLDELDREEKNALTEISGLEKQISLLETSLRLIPKFQEEEFCPDLSGIIDELDSFYPEKMTVDETSQLIQNTVSNYTTLRGSYLQQQNASIEEKQHLQEEFALLQSSGQHILDLRSHWQIENFTIALEEKQKQEVKYQKLQKEIKELRQKAEKNDEKSKALSENILRLSQQISSCKSDINSHTAFIKEQWEKFPSGLSKNADFSLLLTKLQAERKDLEVKQKSLEEKYQKDSTLLLQKKEQVSAADSREKSCFSYKKESSERLLTELSRMNFASDTNLASLYLSEKEIVDETAELENFKYNLAQIRERLQYLEGKRQNRTLTTNEWKKYKETYETTKQCFEKSQQEEALLVHQLETCKIQLNQKEKLLKEQKTAVHKRGLIRQLEQLFKGNAFVEYVAQSRLKYIAAEASSILSSISNGNYALEVNDATEFIIRDNKNGGILRPCDTLSGGETFITSLSLALALSSVIQLNGTAPLELFFLDEGFGSLDDDLLDVVMTSLERLPNKRRSIGIITHVEAIQSRVPVKLIVTPSDISQNGSSIRLEYS